MDSIIAGTLVLLGLVFLSIGLLDIGREVAKNNALHRNLYRVALLDTVLAHSDITANEEYQRTLIKMVEAEFNN